MSSSLRLLGVIVQPVITNQLQSMCSLYVHRAALAPFLANKTAAPDSYKWILYGDDDTFWFIDNVLTYLDQLDPDMPYLLSDNIWMKERTSGIGDCAVSAATLHPLWCALFLRADACNKHLPCLRC